MRKSESSECLIDFKALEWNPADNKILGECPFLFHLSVHRYELLVYPCIAVLLSLTARRVIKHLLFLSRREIYLLDSLSTLVHRKLGLNYETKLTNHCLIVKFIGDSAIQARNTLTSSAISSDIDSGQVTPRWRQSHISFYVLL